MKLARIGRSMISPFGLAMRPRMPASWRICLIVPRAPESAIMRIGLRRSKFFSIASATSSVAAVHLSTTASWRSSCVIRPMSYWSWISATSPSTLARIAPFSGGMITSFLEIVMPACVAYLNPRSLNASSTRATTEAPCSCTSASMTFTVSRLRIGWLMNS